MQRFWLTFELLPPYPLISTPRAKGCNILTITVIFVLHGDMVAPRVCPTFPCFVIDLVLTIWEQVRRSRERERERGGERERHTLYAMYTSSSNITFHHQQA